MLTVAILAQKGGVGKSTLSVNLGVQAWMQGAPVGILDADPQASVSAWQRRRDALGTDGPIVAHAGTPNAPEQVEAAARAAKEDGLQLLLIDTPAGVSELSEAAAAIADLCLLPCVPAVFDMDAMTSTVLLLKGHPGKPAYFVLNRCGRSKEQNMGAAQALSSSFGYTVLPTYLTMRMDIADAGLDGRAFVELESKKPSVVRGQQEFREIGQWLAHQMARENAA